MKIKKFHFISNIEREIKLLPISNLYFEEIVINGYCNTEHFENGVLKLGVSCNSGNIILVSNNCTYSISLNGITILAMDKVPITFDESYYQINIKNYVESKSKNISRFLLQVDTIEKRKIQEIFEFVFQHSVQNTEIYISTAFGIKLFGGQVLIFRDANDWNFNQIYYGNEEEISKILKPYTFIYETNQEIFWTKKVIFVGTE